MRFNFCQLNRTKGGLNAVSAFAKFGKEEQVLELLSNGGKKEDAVYGYALGGYVKKVNDFLKSNPELIIHAAKGYARGNNEAETAKLRQRKGGDGLTIKKALLEGYAQAANMTQSNAITSSRDRSSYMPTLVKGLAQAGHLLVLNYVTNEELQNVAITAAASSGDVDLVNQLLKLQDIILSELAKPLAPTAKCALGHALIGYSRGRHYEHIEHILALGVNPMLCLTAIFDEKNLHESDVQSLSAHICDTPLREHLLTLIKKHFATRIEKDRDFSNDSELEELLASSLLDFHEKVGVVGNSH